MAFPILGAGSLAVAYNIENSLRFNSGDGPKLQTTTGSNSDRRQFTFSCWFKIAQDINDDQTLMGVNDGGHLPHIRINNAMSLNVQISASGSDVVTTNRLFRDHSAWYHLVVAQDTEQGTAANRLKIYVNGVLETSFSAAAYTAQDTDTAWNSNTELSFGRDVNGDDNPFDGYIAEVFWIDGTQYAASDFGETDSSGIWKPKDCKDDLTFGTHGFYFEFKQSGTGTNSSGMGADTSGEDNHYAVTNLTASDQCTDTPTNNFCTWNPLVINSSNVAYLPSSFSEGNLKLTLQNDSMTMGTIGLSSGKWYYEYKFAENSADNQNYPIVGIHTNSHTSSANNMIGRGTPDSTNYQGNKGTTVLDNVFLGIPVANDIFGFYIDLDNETLIIHKNGSTFMASGFLSGIDWSGGLTTGTAQDGFFYPFVQNNGLSITGDEANFGNPSFAISSGNADANGYGTFEYNPTLSSTNYYAICTKNLAKYGG